MSPLIGKLSKGEHPVSLIRYRGISEVREALERGFILVRFTGTQGGTEIGLSLDENGRALDLTSERVRFSGSLELDYQPVKCIVNIDRDTLTGYGSLEVVSQLF